MNEYIVGIDIGSSKVCAAVGKADRQQKLQIIGVTSVNCNGLKKGIVVDIDSTSEAIKNCMEQLERMTDIKITSAYVSLPGGICELIPSKGVVAVSSDNREINRHDVERVLNAARIVSIPSNKEIVGIIPKQYIIDGYENIKDPIGMSGLRLEVDSDIILSQTTIITNLVKSVNKAGIKVSGIVLEPLAVSQSALKQDELKMGTALVDVGADKIDISVYKNGSILHIDTIPYGGNTISNDISVCLKIPFSEAEKLKIKYGSLEKSNGLIRDAIKVNASFNDIINIDYQTLIDVIEARVEELLHIVRVRLKKNLQYDEVAGIVLVGGGISLLNGICEFSRNILDKPVRIGAPEYVGASSPIYNTAVGIIKDVIGSIRFYEETDTESEKSNTKKKSKNKKMQETEESNVVSKIKGFLADFF